MQQFHINLRKGLLRGGMVFGLFLSTSFYASAGVQPLADWQDTGVVIQENQYRFCIDGSKANIALVANEEVGTVAYDWRTKARKPVNTRPYDICAANGLLFSADDLSNPDRGGALRFSTGDPEGRRIDYMPSYVAEDGTLQLYALTYRHTEAGRTLWASADGGLTWRQVDGTFKGKISSIAVSTGDARSIYALVESTSSQVPNSGLTPQFTIFYSSDAGLHWEQRSSLPIIEGAGQQVVSLSALIGRGAPTDTVMATVAGSTGSTQEVLLSSDGGRTFQSLGTINPDLPNYMHLFHTNEGILRLRIDPVANPQGQRRFRHSLDLSKDGGKSWQSLQLPLPAEPLSNVAGLEVVRAAPMNVFMGGIDSAGTFGLYHSADGGHTWQRVGDSYSYVTPYMPLKLLSVRDHKLFLRELPSSELETSITASAVPNNVPNGAYFAETHHNMSGPFKLYWVANGGLAQQGYPLTEPFAEVSETDGNVYTVQYFERAVFEYHPEKKAPNDVLLSLLGVFEYKKKYPNGATGQVPNTTRDSVLFPQTGKRLGGRFLKHWSARGGLAQYGYPISDEFTEVSDLNAKPYRVQYFERAVMEYHPENAGTSYEVLLSQLGTLRLKTKYGDLETVLVALEKITLTMEVLTGPLCLRPISSEHYEGHKAILTRWYK